MTSRPDTTTHPLNWADDAAADTVDPGLAKQAIGWVDFEPINNGHMNEMLRRYGEFLEYLDSVNSDHQDYIRGKLNSQGLPTYSAVALEISFPTAFTAMANGRRYDIEAASVVAVTSAADITIQIVYVDNTGALAVAVGPVVGGISYEPSPLPAGALIERFQVPAGSPGTLAGVLNREDYRRRDPHAPYRYVNEAYDAVAPRQSAMVWYPDELIAEPLGTIKGMNTVSTVPGDGTGGSAQKNTLATTGNVVIVAGSGAVDPKSFDRDLRALVTTYVLTNAKTAGTRKIVTDGKHVAVIHDDFCELFTIAGVSVWSFDQTDLIYDVCMTNDAVYICGIPDAINSHGVLKLSRLTGAVIWGYDHGGQVSAVWSDNVVVHFDGDVSTHLSGATFRIVDALNGEDLANEGGTGLSTTGLADDAVVAGMSFTRYKYAESYDGVLYRSYGPGVGTNVVSEHGKRSAVAGTVPTGRTFAGGSNIWNPVCVDQDYLFVGDGEYLLCVSRESMALQAKRWLGAGTRIYGVASDGQRLYSDGGVIGASEIFQLARGNQQPQKFMKFDAANTSGSEQFPRNAMIPIKG